MTLNSTDLTTNQDCLSINHHHESTANLNNMTSTQSATNSTDGKDDGQPTNETMEQISADELLIEKMETSSPSKQKIDIDQLNNDEQISIQQTIDNVLERTEEKLNNKSSTKKKDKDQLASPKKRAKLVAKESPKDDKILLTSKSPPLIRQPKLQINDKTLKKLRSDDLIFDNNDEDDDDDDDNTNSSSLQDVNHQTKFNNNNDSKNQRNNNNINLMPVVNNVLSRSIAAIFRNSTINQNGEFNSYSALGFNKGPRVKRVCRTFSDVYAGLPKARFPTTKEKNSTNTKSSTQSGKRKSSSTKKSTNNNNNNKSSPSTSKSSNSNSSFKEDDLTECSLDSDDLEITTYIERNLKKEMNSTPSKDLSV